MVNTSPRSLLIFGVPFHDVTFDEAVAWCVDRMKNGPPSCMATANVDFLMQAACDPELQRILFDADLVIADGMPIVRASGKFGPALRERVTGSDITPMLAAACAREGLRVFLLGGAPGVAEKAAAALTARHPGLQIAGTYSPPLAGLLDMNHADILARLREAKPHLLLVAFGAPKQEKFINLHVGTWDVPLAIGIGGTLDFLAGAQTRAPAWVQRIGFEWLWRLGTNPKRLLKRYVSNIGFLFAALNRMRRLRASPPGLPSDPDTATPWTELAERAARGDSCIIASLGERTWLDSEELGTLVANARMLRRRRGRLIVYGGTPRVRRLLDAMGLTQYLEWHPGRLAAEQRKAALEHASRAGTAVVVDGVLRLDLPAELSVARLPEWTKRVESVWVPSIRAVTLDAAATEFLDSAGLGWLLVLRKRCTDQNLSFTSRGFHGPPRQTLRIARAESYFVES